MVPLPIAGLAVLFALIAALSASEVWKILQGRVDGSPVWALAWLVISFVTMCGLSLMRPWARRAAIVGLIFMALWGLGVAALYIAARQPWMALAMTFSTLLPVGSIRYLRRPLVKALFEAKT